ncbi:acyl-CoA synthetase [Pandoraea eparura]|uniref:Acyl-CoA synthetase n=1 Tax=Pandoraea eparura TaxID=2508291 RepID=A0A5E4RBF6_9BURK|nr:DUF4387 domain-containing protein [Pandoraea eparura]VVD60706.1 acyl-CoA synthetase [Pandoraea eparura]
MKTTPLREIASIIRSKNAGPFLLTFDVMFDSDDDFQAVWAGGSFTRHNVAKLFDVDEASVTSIFAVPRGRAIKLTLRRPLAQGAFGESDMYGCQQHAPLLDYYINLAGR